MLSDPSSGCRARAPRVPPTARVSSVRCGRGAPRATAPRPARPGSVAATPHHTTPHHTTPPLATPPRQVWAQPQPRLRRRAGVSGSEAVSGLLSLPEIQRRGSRGSERALQTRQDCAQCVEGLAETRAGLGWGSPGPECLLGQPRLRGTLPGQPMGSQGVLRVSPAGGPEPAVETGLWFQPGLPVWPSMTSHLPVTSSAGPWETGGQGHPFARCPQLPHKAVGSRTRRASGLRFQPRDASPHRYVRLRQGGGCRERPLGTHWQLERSQLRALPSKLRWPPQTHPELCRVVSSKRPEQGAWGRRGRPGRGI